MPLCGDVLLFRGDGLGNAAAVDNGVGSLQGNGFSISESAALRILSGSPSVWSEVTQRSMLRVFPNGSRIDSSNFSPQEFWNAGVPLGNSRYIQSSINRQ